MPSKRERLIRLVADVSLLQGATIRLASGAESNFYFNMKPATFRPEGAHLIAELVLEEAQRDEADFIAGLEMGAVPIIACVNQLSFIRGERAIQGFFVRKVAKDHGTRKLIEGLPEGVRITGKRVLVVDDVTTTGGSVLKAVEAARKAGGDVRTVVTIVDRLEGAEERLSRHGLRLMALTTAKDYGIKS
jgi:orotate phosphoribosyltransferase